MFRWVRFPKGIALLAFLLPWLTVSCSGQPILKSTGLGLAFGNFDTFGIKPSDLGNQESFNLLLIFTIAVIAAGFIISLRKPAKAAALTLCTSVASLAFIGLSMLRYSKSYLGTALDPDAAHPMAKSAAAMIRIHYEYGFWITIAGLVTAAVLSFISMRRDPDQQPLPHVSKAAPPTSPN